MIRFEFKYLRDGKIESFFIFADSMAEAWEKWTHQYGQIYTVQSVKEWR